MNFWKRSCGLTRLNKVKNDKITARAVVNQDIMNNIEKKGMVI